MIKYTYINMDELFSYLETKLGKSRVNFLRDSISEDEFENVEYGGIKIKGIVFHKPTGMFWHLPAKYSTEYGIVYENVKDIFYIIQSCLEQMLSKKENVIVDEWIKSLKNDIDTEKFLQNSDKINLWEWDDPVFLEGCFFDEPWFAVDYVIGEMDWGLGYEDFCKRFPKFFYTSIFTPIIPNREVYELFENDFEERDDINCNKSLDLVGWDELQKAYNEFYEKNKDVGLFWENESKIIVFSECDLLHFYNVYINEKYK